MKGFYSAKQLAETNSSSIYLTVDGKEVEVTEVGPSSNWSDAKFVGKVTNFVRKVHVPKNGYGNYE